jgi:hypothetical protein
VFTQPLSRLFLRTGYPKGIVLIDVVQLMMGEISATRHDSRSFSHLASFWRGRKQTHYPLPLSSHSQRNKFEAKISILYPTDAKP